MSADTVIPGGIHTDNLIFSLNATMPVFLVMVLGYVLHQIHWINDPFAGYLNGFVFKFALPIYLFRSLAEADFYAVWDMGLIVFSFVVTALSILMMLVFARGLKDRSLRAEFVQAGYRSSQALLGAALMQNVYSDTSALSLILIGSVPLYNVTAVVLLTLMAPEGGHLDRKTVGRTLKGIVTNPIILAIAVGMVWSLLRIPQPLILQRVVDSIAPTATPLGLIALGASIDLKKAVSCWKPTLAATVLKLVGFAAVFLPLAVWLGYRETTLLALLVMLASPTTISSFPMARSLGHDGTLTSGTVVLTTVCSAFTFTGWLYLLKTLALI